MVLSRRALMAATAGLSVGGAGCLSDGSCETVVDRTERVERGGFRVYDADTEASQRLYIRLRRIEGPGVLLRVFDPAEEPVVERRDVERLERVVDVTEPGRYSVMIENDSTDVGRWQITVVVYRGWCPDVF